MTTASLGTANHPFRATLPAHVLQTLPRHEPEVQARIDAAARTSDPLPAPEGRRWRISTQDVKDFLLAYIACFLAVSAWLG